jgi:hypothetical protein
MYVALAFQVYPQVVPPSNHVDEISFLSASTRTAPTQNLVGVELDSLARTRANAM